MAERPGVVKRRRGQEGSKVSFGWSREEQEDAGIICATYHVHEFQIPPQCVKL